MPELTEHELETAKLYQDTFKHMTTFCSGAVLLSSSVVAAFFEDPTSLWVLFCSLGLFLVGAATATVGLRTNAVHLDSDFRAGANDADAERRKQWRATNFEVSVAAAYFGVATFAAFVLSNFW